MFGSCASVFCRIQNNSHLGILFRFSCDNLYTPVKSKIVPVLIYLHHSVIFTFHVLPSTVHSAGFSFYFFTGFLVICSCCHKKNIRDTRSTAIAASFPCHLFLSQNNNMRDTRSTAIEPFYMQFDLHLFSQAATVIG